MNIKLINFYINGYPDDFGRTFDQMMNQSDDWWEETHNFIQWVFPTNTPSRLYLDAPILDLETIKKFRSSYDVETNMTRAIIKFMSFLKLYEKNPSWICERPHNLLRVSRAIESSLLCMSHANLATFFFNAVVSVETDSIFFHDSRIKYWEPMFEDLKYLKI